MIKKISLKYLTKNINRTFVLILCIASVCSFIFSKSLIEKNSKYNEMLFAHHMYSGYNASFNNTGIKNIDAIKQVDGVKKVIYTNSLDKITYKNGVDISLCNYNKDYYDINRFRLVKGRLPENNHEIVIEKRAIEEIDSKYKLNQSFEFSKIIDNDINSKHDISVEKLKYKIVGIIDRNKAYYDSAYSLTAFTSGEKSDKYDGYIAFSQELNDREVYEKIREVSGINDENLRFNEKLSMAMGEYEEAKGISNYKEMALILLAATLLIFNIFNMFANGFIKEIGELKVIGASKKHIVNLFFTQFLIIWIIGSILGLIFGGAISSIVIKKYIFSLFAKAKFTLSITDILYPVAITLLITFISGFIPILKSSNMSAIECIDKSENNRISKGIKISTSKIYIKNLVNVLMRNITHVCVAVISFAILGTMFFNTTFRMTNGFNVIDMQQNNLFINDMVLSPNLVDNNLAISNITEKEYIKAQNSGNYKMINYKKVIPYSYLILDKAQISKSYFDYKNFVGDKVDMPVTFKAYSQNMDSDINKYIESGSIKEINKEETDFIPAVMTSKYYNMISSENADIFSKGVKVGDTYNIKIISIQDENKVEYNKKLKIVGIINEDWLFKGNSNFGFNPEIIISSKNIDKLGMKDKYTQVGFVNNKEYEQSNKQNLVENFKDEIQKSRYNIFDISTYMKKHDINERIYLREKLSQISVILILAMLNLVFMIRASIIKRKREFSIMRSLGMSLKEKYRWIILENVVISVFIILINVFIAIGIYYNETQFLNQLYMDIYSRALFNFRVPYKEILYFVVLILASMLLGIISSNKSIKDDVLYEDKI